VSWLALDTATSEASVAVGRTAETASVESVAGSRRHAAELLAMIDRALAAQAIALRDLRGVIVADGPGSFTGLRVGAAVAKALARTLGLPVLVAPSLMARALAAGHSGDAMLVTADALRGEVYAAVYRFGPAGVETLSAPAVTRRDDLHSLRSGGAREVDEAPPSAAWLIALAAMPGGARPLTDVHAWEPEYGRPAEAQAQWERTHRRPLPDPAGPPV
jgi:tRNA threonylcarbamoyl adenosine modification protein YeaZ